jgi:hypothetical protein
MPEGALDHDQAALDAPRHQAVERRIENNRSSAESAIASRHVYIGRARARRLRTGRVRMVRHLQHRAGSGTCLRLHRRWRLAQPLEVFRDSGREVPRRRGALRPVRLCLGTGCLRTRAERSPLRRPAGPNFFRAVGDFTSLDHVAKTTRATGL